MAYPLKRYLLGEWELETEKRLLHRDGESVRLANKPFQVFFYLIENRDRLVSRGELLDRFWQGSDVYDASLTQCVGAIRRALHDHLDNPRFIETRWAAGYRYIGPIEIQPVEDVSSVIEVERTHAVRVLIEEEEILDAAATSEPTLVLPSRSNPASSTLRQFSRQAVPLMAACSFLALAALAAIVYRNNGNSSEPVPLRSIAVMPLKNLTGDASNEYLSDGMTDNLTSSLARVQGLKVISRSSAFTFKGKEADPQEVGKKLGVSAVLEGSLLRSGERLRAEIRLVSTTDGRVVWASTAYDRALGDIFALQDEIARNVVAELRLGLNSQGEQQLARRYTNNVDAYHAYLKALYFSNKRTPEGLEKAFAYLDEAIARDPHYALAYAKLADTHYLAIWFMQAPPQAAMKKVKEAAERAVEIDERLAEGHLALASSYDNWDLRNCRKEIDRALELDPGSAEVRHHYAYSLLLADRPEEAVTEIKRALELDPLSVGMNVDVGEILLYSRRYDEAIEALRKALEMDRHRPNVHHDLAEAYEQKGMEREAVAEYIEEDAVAGENQQTIADLKEAYAGSGMRGFWQKKLDSFKEKSKHSYFPPFVIAEIYARLGEKDRAFIWLEKAYDERSPLIINLKNLAVLDSLRSDARFADLVHRVGLPG